jgi:DNA-binding LacI/PurR family transcriptional regulator
MVPEKTQKTGVKRRQATLTDAARIAGVSPMTVSRVVNGNGYVSSTLRRKVERVLEKLEYSPNRLARSLKGTRNNVVGVLLPDLANPFSVELARGIEESLSARGYYSFVISAGRDGQREKAAIEAFSDHRVEGAILTIRAPRPGRTGTKTESVDMAHFARNRFPLVVVGPEFAGEGVDHVTASYREGAFRATAHLIESGRRRIAYIGSALTDLEPLLRFQGYLDAMAEYGIAVHPELVTGPSRFAGWCSDADGYHAMKHLLALPNPPDAVFTRNDYAAIGALRAMHEREVRVPDDIAAVGFDNVSISAFTSPALTTVDQFVFEQGKAAGKLLLERMDSARPRRQPFEEKFPCELVVRQSSAVRVRAAA